MKLHGFLFVFYSFKELKKDSTTYATVFFLPIFQRKLQIPQKHFIRF